jgi:hypothetical protein
MADPNRGDSENRERDNPPSGESVEGNDRNPDRPASEPTWGFEDSNQSDTATEDDLPLGEDSHSRHPKDDVEGGLGDLFKEDSSPVEQRNDVSDTQSTDPRNQTNGSHTKRHSNNTHQDKHSSPQPHQQSSEDGGAEEAQWRTIPRDDQPTEEEADPSEHFDAELPDEEDERDVEDFIKEIETSQEYIKILPVRDKINSETVSRELYGLHKYGTGRKLPLDMELHIDAIQGVSNFEFIIYKPEGSSHFDFYLGPGERGDVSTDRLESATRSQYPEDFEFDRKDFDITTIFNNVPHMVRYEGREERRKDWMTTLTTYDTETVDRSPLSNLLETAIQSDGSVIFQVIFEPRSDWSRKAERQKGLLKQGVNSTAGMIGRTILDGILGVSDEEKAERHRAEAPQEVGGSIHDSQTAGQRHGTDRMGQIDLKDPSHTYNVSIRAATSLKDCAENLTDSLNHLSGQFYTIEGEYLGQNEYEYKRMLSHGITYPNGYELVGRQKPFLVCNVKELANFITVPSIDSLPKASRAGTGGTPKAQSPLTSPNEEIFREFSDGMTIGRAVTAIRDTDVPPSDISAIESKNEWWDQLNQRHAIGLSASDLTHHYFRAATTGSGKTVATVNDILSTYTTLNGPTVVVDPKGGDMCENYLRCHRTLFGDLDDVEYIKIPEEDGMIPGIPFFDLRPLVEAGDLERATAVQNIVDHYFQVLYFALGKETVDQAFVANEILTNLIKACFDPVYGSDHFSIGELLEVAQNFQQFGAQVDDLQDDALAVSQALPQVSDDQVESILLSHLQKDQRQFMNTTDAVLNRIRKLKERDFIWDMLSFDVDDEHWDHDTGWYDREAVPMLDLKSVLNSDKVILIDTGDIHGKSSKMFTMLFLSHLWTSVRSIWTPNDDDYIANVIIEESADIARTEIVYEDLLPKGREFNMSLGLIMQYPEQVLGDDPQANRRAYKEILNNVNTKIIGNIATDDMLAESLFHEDLDSDEVKDRIAGLRRGEWVVQLPSTGFHEQKPEILTLKPLPIPPGHDEGPFEVRSQAELIRRRSRARHCVSRDHDAIDVASATANSRAPSEAEQEVKDEDKDDIEGEGLSHKHLAYLELVFDALTDGVDGYTLGKSMKELSFSETSDDLEAKGYLEKEYLGNNEIYYKPTKKAETTVDRTLSPEGGGEKGNESLTHRIGVRLTATYYEQQGYDAKMYHSPDGDSNVYDVFVAPDDNSPNQRHKIVEVETSPEKRGHVEGDYDKLTMAYGEAVWVVENFKGAKKLLRSLSDKLESTISTESGNFSSISDKLDSPGAHEILSINNLRDEVEQ